MKDAAHRDAAALGPVRIWSADPEENDVAEETFQVSPLPASQLSKMFRLSRHEKVILTSNTGDEMEEEAVGAVSVAAAASTSVTVVVLTDEALYSATRVDAEKLSAESEAPPPTPPSLPSRNSKSNGSTSGAGIGGWLRGLLPGASPRTPPPSGEGSGSDSSSAVTEQRGFQQWRHGSSVVSRLDLTLIEAASVLSSDKAIQAGVPPVLLIQTPRSAVPSAYMATMPTSPAAARGDAAARRSSRRESSALVAAAVGGGGGGGKSIRAALFYAVGGTDACRLWHIGARHAMHQKWQRLLETNCLPPPEVYQAHTRAKELPPHPSRASPLSRLLVVSDKRVYSVHRDGLNASGVAWAADLAGLSQVDEIVVADKKTGAAYPYAILLRWSKPGQPPSTFAVKERDDLQAMSACVRQAHQLITGEALPVKALHYG